MRANNAIEVSCLDLACPGSIAQGKSARFLQFTVSIFFLFFGCALPCAKATTVWLDTDASIGSPFREVDDAFAILLALRCSNLRIAGISTTYGNAPLRTTTAVTTDLIGRFGGRIPKVHQGAGSRKDLGVETAATEGLAKALRENRSLVYVALGPLTNLATFEMLHPELAREFIASFSSVARSKIVRSVSGPGIRSRFTTQMSSRIPQPSGACSRRKFPDADTD